MRTRRTLLLPALLAAASAALPACTPDTETGEAARVWAPPDLSGVWMAFAVENPDGGGNAPRYSAEGEAALASFAAQFSSIPETGAWCYGTGMPSLSHAQRCGGRS